MRRERLDCAPDKVGLKGVNSHISLDWLIDEKRVPAKFGYKALWNPLGAETG